MGLGKAPSESIWLKDQLTKFFYDQNANLKTSRYIIMIKLLKSGMYIMQMYNLTVMNEYILFTL